MAQVIRARVAGCALLLLSGCTPMFATRLSSPVRADLGVVTVTADEVHLDERLRAQDFSSSSRVLVALLLRTRHPTTFDLGRLRLSLTDAHGRRDEAAAIASGVGEPPHLLDDGETAGLLSLRPDAPVRAWVAFGELPSRRTRELPERVELHLTRSVPKRPPRATIRGAAGLQAASGSVPGQERSARHGGAVAPVSHTLRAAPVSLVLSEPGREPIWNADPVASSSSIGAHFQLFPDASTLNLVVNETHAFIDPLVLVTSFGIGFSNACDDNADWCENLALRAQLGWPVWRGRLGALAPFAGAELAWGFAKTSKLVLAGPSLGVDVALGPLQPQHGPFPVNYARSPLGRMHLRAGLVLWFGDDMPTTGQPGLVFAISHAFGH